MKKIDVTDAVCATLQRFASGFSRTPDEVRAHLLHLPNAAVSSLSPAEEFVEACRPNNPTRPDRRRPPSWATMNSDPATKRRLLSRVLAFIGYRDDLGECTGGAIGLKRAPPPTASRPSGRRCHGLSCP